eukprot:CAMPEP_0176090538 /NCGR_PEP_ID=MMETSP0120_2-20121206/45344_1 /TAXON_ID=160619 /ORGANISM="Kryptoperidinium foliaceum, Strain CCMP 1326" /LENGTH=74 /DNA_ID=CAMNT_0017424421 /DNA_START=119 /DNA_END=339 /DNA_ORIENTATION=-
MGADVYMKPPAIAMRLAERRCRCCQVKDSASPLVIFVDEASLVAVGGNSAQHYHRSAHIEGPERAGFVGQARLL